MIQGGDGNFYGTTTFGGADDLGTVFMVTAAGVMTTLVEFTGVGGGKKGSYPYAALVRGSDGNFYGTTSAGGGDNDFGTVFKMTPTGVFTTLVEFTGLDGSSKGREPQGQLVEGRDGNFYGTTSLGGTGNFGTVFKLTPARDFTTLVEFTGIGGTATGSRPKSALLQGMSPDDSFYGTTSKGGLVDLGTVFKMTSAGVRSTLVEFTGTGGGAKGSSPQARLMQGSADGNFYGTTLGGGGEDFGTVFRMATNGALTTLLEFTAPDSSPRSGLVEGSDHALYGTVSGPQGAIYRFISSGAPLLMTVDPQVQNTTSAIVTAKLNAAGFSTAATMEYGGDGINFPNSVPVAVDITGYQTKLVGTTLDGLSPGTTYYYRFRAINSAGTTVSAVQSFSTLAAPLVVSLPASNILPTSATFNGAVNARNYPAAVSFEWSEDVNFSASTLVSVPGAVTGNLNVLVSINVAGLIKGTTYYYRVKATNAGGTPVSGTQSFTTLTDPLATVGPATLVTSQSAQLNGSVNALGALTSVSFEYGTDGVHFPSSVGATPPTVNGSAPVAVSATLSGLIQGATYYYRVKGTSVGGVGYSTVATLTLDILSGFTQEIPGSPPEAQGYMLVYLSPSGIRAGWRFLV
ncbi:MAG: choice-of-anchor tandem repeat GloVer-containing protein, partial [Verrucomicrobiota bacterium]